MLLTCFGTKSDFFCPFPCCVITKRTIQRQACCWRRWWKNENFFSKKNRCIFAKMKGYANFPANVLTGVLKLKMNFVEQCVKSVLSRSRQVCLSRPRTCHFRKIRRNGSWFYANFMWKKKFFKIFGCGCTSGEVPRYSVCQNWKSFK